MVMDVMLILVYDVNGKHGQDVKEQAQDPSWANEHGEEVRGNALNGLLVTYRRRVVEIEELGAQTGECRSK